MHFENYKFNVREQKKLRIIIDTDAACEADDQYAIAHALMTPRFDVRGIIAEQFYRNGGEDSVNKSYAEVVKVLDLMGVEGVPVVRGYFRELQSEDDIPQSDGADLIISEALKQEDKPLFILCQGAITNVGIALRKRPDIAGRFTCIWIGGGVYEDETLEYNLCNDTYAANTLYHSSVELWQVPMECYSQMQIGYAELQTRLLPCGKVGKYLFDELQQVGMENDWPCGESWALGDSPAPALALNPNCGRYTYENAPVISEDKKYSGFVNEHIIRVYHSIDSRYILEDFFAKLLLNFGHNE